MLIKKMFVPLMVVLFLTAGAVVASGQWQSLDKKNVRFDVDHDQVEGVFSKLAVKELKFSVEDGPVNFHRVVITFKGGEKQEIEFMEKLVEGGESRTIAIEGTDRTIQQVDFWYEMATAKGKQAKVTLWGR